MHNCPRCGCPPTVQRLAGYYVACDNCYDGAPDSSTRYELGAGLTLASAVQQWNDRMEDAYWEREAS